MNAKLPLAGEPDELRGAGQRLGIPRRQFLQLFDAVAGGGAAGSMVRLEGDRIPAAFSNRLSPHQHGINDLLATLQLLGRAPGRVAVLGVVPDRIALGLDLSPEVETALPALVARVVTVTGAAPSASAARAPDQEQPP